MTSEQKLEPESMSTDETQIKIDPEENTEQVTIKQEIDLEPVEQVPEESVEKTAKLESAAGSERELEDEADQEMIPDAMKESEVIYGS